MTSISSSSLSLQRSSPLSRLQQTLAAEITSGKIKAGDQDALGAALESIDSAMQSAKASGTRPSPEEGKAKVESMIDDMVSSGSLTAEQASELKGVFEDTFAGGPGGAKGKMGPPPPPPAQEDEEDTSSDSVSLTLTGSSSDVSALLQKLLENLASGNASTYSNSATTSSSVSALFLDKSA